MKTVLEIPDAIFKKAASYAAENGISVKELFNQALAEKLHQPSKESPEQPWMKLFGEFGKTATARAETRRIQSVIDQEFENIESEDRVDR